MVKINVISGDIGAIKSDALITAINSQGAWYGGIDGVIQRLAGDYFHANARLLMPLEDGETIVVRKQSKQVLEFERVVFIVDDLKQPLRFVILRAMEAAELAGAIHVTLPTIRLGVMLGVVEKTVQEALEEMVLGVNLFLVADPDNVKIITFVIYNDQFSEQTLRQAFAEGENDV